MLGFELPLRPARSGLELDTEEIANLAIDAVSDRPQQAALRIGDLDYGVDRDGYFHLEARPRKRDILQVGQGSPDSSRLILPLNIDEVCTKHPRFSAPIHHICVSIGFGQEKD